VALSRHWRHLLPSGVADWKWRFATTPIRRPARFALPMLSVPTSGRERWSPIRWKKTRARVVTAGETVLHRESFALAPGAQIQFGIAVESEAQPRSLLRIEITPRPAAPARARILGRTALLEAALGRQRAADRREGTP
jgi:hypothetical protein